MTIQPITMTDELASGYLGRVLQLNGWPAKTSGLRFLGKRFGQQRKSAQGVYTIDILASISGIPLAEFVCKHTMIPLRRAVAKSRSEVAHGSLKDAPALYNAAMRESRREACFCHKCIDEDYEQNGIPYWRREHQIPGIYRCDKHDDLLSFVKRENAFEVSPAAWLKNYQRISVTWSDQLQQNSCVQRYILIAKHFLTATRPLDARMVTRAVQLRAKKSGLDIKSWNMSAPRLNDLFQSSFDNEWLKLVLPNYIGGAEGQWCGAFDNAHSQRLVSSVYYMLAFAVLCESADDAVKAMSATPNDL